MAYAINPYSFVPFGGEVEKQPLDDYYPASKSLLTGRLDVTMIAKTPLIVPDGANYQETALQTNTDTPDTHKTYTFYHVKDENGEMRYAIPGSSLRGVLRSAYEAVTNSCLPFFPDNKELSRRTPLNGAFKNRGLFGLVEDSDGKYYWTLYDVTDATYTTNKMGVKNGIFRLPDTAPWLHTGQEVIFKKHPGYTSIEAIYPANLPPAGCDPLLWEKGWIQFNIPVSGNKRMWMDVEEFYHQYGALDTGGDKHIPVLCKVGKDRNRRECIKDLKKFEYGEPIDGYTTGRIMNISEVRNAQQNRQRRVRAEIRVDIPYHIHILSPGKELKRWPVEPGEKPEETEVFRLLQYSIETTTLEQTMQRGSGKVKVSTAGDLLKALNRAAGTKKRKPAGNLVPVYYHAGENGVYYLSGSAVGRVGQARRWSDILGRDNANGDHSPCKSLTDLCPACALFGTAEAEETAEDALTGRPSKVKGAKGRLRFTDAIVSTADPIALETHTLQILANPKPTAYEFYQIQPEDNSGEPAVYWNFDYFGVKDKTPGHSRETVFKDLPKPTPRGRKFYWHRDALAEDADEQNNMNATMDALPAETELRFHIYFDRIQEYQLRNLIWLITIGENKLDGTLWHHLGHAKPLGYGSVKMVVTGCQVRCIGLEGDSITIAQKPFFDGNQIPLKPEWYSSDGKIQSDKRASDCMLAFRKLCDSTAVTETEDNRSVSVDYPRHYSDGMIYTWFSKNRTTNQDHPYPVTLPHPSQDSSQKLPLDPENEDTRRRMGQRGNRSGIDKNQNPLPQTHMSQVNVSAATPMPEIGKEYDCVAISERGKTWEVKLKDFDVTGTLQLPKKAKVKFRKNMVVRGKVKSIDPNDKKPKLEYIQ